MILLSIKYEQYMKVNNRHNFTPTNHLTKYNQE